MKFAFCPDSATWEEERARVRKVDLIDIREYPTTTGMCSYWKERENGSMRALIVLHEALDASPVQLVSVIAHECYHLSKIVFEAASEDEPGEETVAYMLSELVTVVWEDFCDTRGRARFPKVVQK